MQSTDKKKAECWIEFYDSFEDMLRFFCDNTTIHGSIRLNCSRKNKMKTTFWLLLFFLSFAMMYWQFGEITSQYWAYPTSTTINLQSKSKIFPAVTICNLNPYRFDQVNKYINQLDQLAQQALYSLYKYKASIALEEQEVFDLKDILPNGSNQFNQSFVLDRSITLLKLQENGLGPALPGQTKSKVGFQLCNSVGEDCYYTSFWSGVDALHEWYKFHLVNIMSNIPPVLNLAMGDLAKNVIFTCDFNGKPCDERQYVYFHHPFYGSCFTINNHGMENPLNSTRPGKQYGLSLKVKADQNDYLPLLSTVAGARILIHNPFQPPLVEHEGFDIKPGTETSIRVRQDEITHLGGKYGECTADGKELGINLLYNTSYTHQACLHSCFQYQMLKLCGCAYYFYPLPSGAEYCNYNKHQGWGHCFYRLYEKMLDHRLICSYQCPKQCKKTKYQVSVGSSKWPSPISKVIPLLSWQKRYNKTSKRSDVSKINVYYEELSYRSIDEIPAIPVTLLLSSMGGLWSWWFGSSVLSVAELAELVLDIVVMLIIITYRWNKLRTSSSKTNVAVSIISQCPMSYHDSRCLHSP
ncbi:hypothetical protein GDO86_012644, partial [Hymenochirus boettgeri]